MNQNGKKRRLLCWLTAVVMLFTAIPVQAAFDDFSDGTFSSGVSSDGYVPTVTPQATPAITPEAGPSVTPEITPELTPEATPSVTPAITPEATPSVTPEVTESPIPTPTWAPDQGAQVTVKFADATGTKFYEELEISTAIGETITLPNVPEREGLEGNTWKLEKDKVLAKTFTFDGEQDLALSPKEDLVNYIKDGVLVLYALQNYTIRFYNNSGTGMFGGSTLKKYEGTVITMPDFPYGTYVNYGWTTVKGSPTVQYKIGASYTVTGNQDFYIIRYQSKTVTFLNPGGSTSSAMNKLKTTVIKGTTMKLPAVPTLTGYKNLGWSLEKNATTAKYAAGKTITVNRDLTFYAVRKRLPYTVTFNNNGGTSTSKVYTSLKQYVAKNTIVTLPAVPKVTGYTNVGWTTEKGGSTPIYKAGSVYKITKSTKFYAVRKKAAVYTVTFCLGDGSTNTAYKNLKMKVSSGTTIKFPAVPTRSGYVNYGWTGTKNGTTATKNTSYTVRRNVKFYAVQKKGVTVALRYNDGTLYKKIVLGKGDYLDLPCVANKAGYTFMGWSTTSGQSVNPTYEAEQNIRVTGNLNLYATVFNRANESNLSVSNLTKVDTKKYKRVIFVGDSRTVYMRNTLMGMGASAYENVDFVCHSGQGLYWLQNTAYSDLNQLLAGYNLAEKPTAIVFNLGVNDLSNLSNYVLYMNSIANALEKKNCKLFYMSVNPVNSKMLAHYRSSEVIRQFNSIIKSSLSAHYTFINSYGFLMHYGYGTDNGYGTDDGLHYTASTYKRIYKYALTQVNSH